jgi:undecaprenyl-diphosphatase
MTYLQAIILGIVQGITEFLPISSSGHLVLVPSIFNWHIAEEFLFPFDVIVQMGTLIAVIIYFWKDLLQIVKAILAGLRDRKPFETEDARLGWLIVLATIPAGLIGYLFDDVIEQFFHSPSATAAFLIGTALLLFIAERFGKQEKELNTLNWKDALWIGFSQILALLPGVSRSGSTITGGMVRGYKRTDAARFSFLLSIPIMIGAGFFKFLDLLEMENFSSYLPYLAVGFVTAGIVGYLSIRWLLGYLGKHSLTSFAIYCAIIGTIMLALFGLSALSEPKISQEISTPEIWSIQISPELAWMEPIINNCSQQIENIAIRSSEIPMDRMALSNTDVSFIWGTGEMEIQNAYILANDSINFVVHPQNPMTSLTRNELTGLFSTKLLAGNVTYDIWSYAAGNPLLDIVNEAFGHDFSFHEDTLLVPSPKEMREAIAESPNAIGFLTGFWIDDTVKTISIENSAIETLEIPIIAVISGDINENQKKWLLCIQNSIIASAD